MLNKKIILALGASAFLSACGGGSSGDGNSHSSPLSADEATLREVTEIVAALGLDGSVLMDFGRYSMDPTVSIQTSGNLQEQRSRLNLKKLMDTIRADASPGATDSQHVMAASVPCPVSGEVLKTATSENAYALRYVKCVVEDLDGWYEEIDGLVSAASNPPTDASVVFSNLKITESKDGSEYVRLDGELSYKLVGSTTTFSSTKLTVKLAEPALSTITLRDYVLTGDSVDRSIASVGRITTKSATGGWDVRFSSNPDASLPNAAGAQAESFITAPDDDAPSSGTMVIVDQLNTQNVIVLKAISNIMVKLSFWIGGIEQLTKNISWNELLEGDES